MRCFAHSRSKKPRLTLLPSKGSILGNLFSTELHLQTQQSLYTFSWKLHNVRAMLRTRSKKFLADYLLLAAKSCSVRHVYLYDRNLLQTGHCQMDGGQDWEELENFVNSALMKCLGNSEQNLSLLDPKPFLSASSSQR